MTPDAERFRLTPSEEREEARVVNRLLRHAREAGGFVTIDRFDVDSGEGRGILIAATEGDFAQALRRFSQEATRNGTHRTLATILSAHPDPKE